MDLALEDLVEGLEVALVMGAVSIILKILTMKQQRQTTQPLTTITMSNLLLRIYLEEFRRMERTLALIMKKVEGCMMDMLMEVMTMEEGILTLEISGIDCC